jgi:glucuronoarabinoxylan endo-1,4-beta-xylanase
MEVDVRNIGLRSVLLAGAILAWGCSSSSPGGNGAGSGGAPGSGGSTTPQSGGSGGGSGGTGSGGSTTNLTGGSTGSGGTAEKGGTTSSGGSVGKGGATASGGGPGSGGSAGSNAGGSKTGGSAAGGATGTTGGSSGGGATGKGGATAAGGTTGGGGAAGGATGQGGSTVIPTGVTVQLADKHQTIEGFGFNTALGGGSPNWDAFFGANGLGFSIVRVGMTSSGGLSGAKPAASYNAKVIGSVWTAPANYKDNNSTTKGGHLKKENYDAWAQKIADFAKAQGLYAMAAQNEPDFASCGSSIGPPCNGDYDTMVFTAQEMVDFIKVLGPKMQAAKVKLIAPEPSEWIHLWSNASATGSTVASHPNSSDPLGCGCFSNTPTTTGCASKCASGGGYDYGHWLAKDATAWGYIDIIGTHEYDSQKAEAWPSDVDGGKRSKPVYETEVSGVMYWPEQGPSSDIKNGIAVAGWVHSALVVGEASAWLYWWYQQSSDNEGLVLSGTLTKRCYTIGNYSKFVKPGYVMVGVAGNSNADLLLSAFTGTDGTVIVAINKGSKDLSVPITIAGGTAPASCTPNVTSASDDLKAGTAVTVTGGILTAALAATTVTTFVCK